MDKEYKANIQTLLFVIRRKIVWILIFAMLGGLAMGLVSIYLIDPVYSSTAKFYVENNTENNGNALTYQDLNAAKSLVNTCITIIKNNEDLLLSIADTAGYDFTAEEVKNMISTSVVSNTEVFSVKMSSTDPKIAYNLATAVVQVVPQGIESVLSAGGVNSFDSPKMAKQPDSPNIQRNIVIGAMVCAVISFVSYFLSEVLDVTIYTEEDIKKDFTYPIIGLIPTFDAPVEVKLQNKQNKKAKKA